ncbi:hypothetical protein V7O67_06990 [Methanolobus sp. ZRKC4]
MKMNIWILLFIAGVYLILHFGILKKIKSNPELAEISFSLKGPRVKYKIQRNYENLEIAHRIYTELITRKAANPIDYEHDVIKEIYDSWYQLFKVTREELKQLSGKSLQDRRNSDQLIQMSTDILNMGLRPHLTKYQATFRKWYEEELETEGMKGQSPQMIQKNFPEYTELIESMREVNQLLIDYSEQLHTFIIGECGTLKK